MNTSLRRGLKVLMRYYELKQSIRFIDVLLASMIYIGAPHIPSSLPVVKHSTNQTQCSTELIIRKYYILTEEKHSIFMELSDIEAMIDALPPKCARLIAWRYIVGAKREAVAKRLGISLRHYSRIRSRALNMLGEMSLTTPNQKNWNDAMLKMLRQ